LATKLSFSPVHDQAMLTLYPSKNKLLIIKVVKDEETDREALYLARKKIGKRIADECKQLEIWSEYNLIVDRDTSEKAVSDSFMEMLAEISPKLNFLSSRVSSVGSALATFVGVHGSSQVRTRPWSTEFSDIVATGFTQTITKGTWLEELDYVND